MHSQLREEAFQMELTITSEKKGKRQANSFSLQRVSMDSIFSFGIKCVGLEHSSFGSMKRPLIVDDAGLWLTLTEVSGRREGGLSASNWCSSEHVFVKTVLGYRCWCISCVNEEAFHTKGWTWPVFCCAPFRTISNPHRWLSSTRCFWGSDIFGSN